MTDWRHELNLAGSENRGPVLLEAITHTDRDEARKLVADYWTVCEAWGDDLDDALLMLEELGFIGDPLPDQEWLEIYRATTGEDDEPDGGSWTLDRAVAEKFARGLTSPRAKFVFGIWADEPVIWRATVMAGDVLAHFTDRSESEVVIGHGAAWEVAPVAKLVRSG